LTQEPAKKRERKQKTIEDIKFKILKVDGVEEEMLTTSDAAVYTGLSWSGFWKFLKRHPEIRQYAAGYDETRERYLKKKDLDEAKERMQSAYPVEPEE
jgi:hypothetical protein